MGIDFTDKVLSVKAAMKKHHTMFFRRRDSTSLAKAASNGPFVLAECA